MTEALSEIVCTLSEPEMRSRKDVFRRDLTPFLTEATYAAGTSQLAFREPDVTRHMLEQLIELERECCPFFNFDISETETSFQLSVTGPEGSEDMVRNFFSTPNGSGCGCVAPDQTSRAKTTIYVTGFVTMCAIACAIPPALAALGLIGVATGAYIGKGVEAAVMTLTLLALGYFLVRYLRKRRRGAHL